LKHNAAGTEYGRSGRRCVLRLGPQIASSHVFAGRGKRFNKKTRRVNRQASDGGKGGKVGWPLMRVRFAGCHVPVSPRHRRARQRGKLT